MIKYTLYKTYYLNGTHNPITLTDSRQICRFCNKSSPEVTFSNRAHCVSESLGNKKLFSKYECDACNSAFSNVEGELARFLHLYRGLRGLKGKKGAITLGTGVKIAYSHANKTFELNTTENWDKNLSIIPFANKIQFHFKQKYIPLSVYRSFLKFALTVVDESDFNNYQHYLPLLLDADTSSFDNLGIYTIVLNDKLDRSAIKIYKNNCCLSTAPKILIAVEFEQFVYNIFLVYT